MLLLDTDVMIDVLRGHDPALAWLEGLRGEVIVLPGFVAMELVQGCRNRQEQRVLLEELRAFRVVWPGPGACDRALDLFVDHHLSHGIGLLDALIGQLAVELHTPLYTFNEKHYRAIPGLKLVKPYERAGGAG